MLHMIIFECFWNNKICKLIIKKMHVLWYHTSVKNAWFSYDKYIIFLQIRFEHRILRWKQIMSVIFLCVVVGIRTWTHVNSVRLVVRNQRIRLNKRFTKLFPLIDNKTFLNKFFNPKSKNFWIFHIVFCTVVDIVMKKNLEDYPTFH